MLFLIPLQPLMQLGRLIVEPWGAGVITMCSFRLDFTITPSVSEGPSQSVCRMECSAVPSALSKGQPPWGCSDDFAMCLGIQVIIQGIFPASVQATAASLQSPIHGVPRGRRSSVAGSFRTVFENSVPSPALGALAWKSLLALGHPLVFGYWIIQWD